MIQRKLTAGRIRGIVGVVLFGGLIFQCQRTLDSRAEENPSVAVKVPVKPGPNAAVASPSPTLITPAESMDGLAARDPIAFFERALDRYDRSVRDYRCNFVKQELVGGKLTDEQVIETLFREKPFSVRMKWVKNADKCEQVLYVEHQWVKDGQDLAVIEPGPIARLFVPYVMRPIHGRDAERSSRRTIDQFGLRNSMELTLKFVKRAREQGVPHVFAYAGRGEVDERSTFVFERQLPYTDEQGEWPDRMLVVHVDEELLVPTSCTAYADLDKTKLLGRYQSTNIELNVNLPDSTFTKESMGLE